eukprot:165753_1
MWSGNYIATKRNNCNRCMVVSTLEIAKQNVLQCVRDDGGEGQTEVYQTHAHILAKVDRRKQYEEKNKTKGKHLMENKRRFIKNHKGRRTKGTIGQRKLRHSNSSKSQLIALNCNDSIPEILGDAVGVYSGYGGAHYPNYCYFLSF